MTLRGWHPVGWLISGLLVLVVGLLPPLARADALADLDRFVETVRSGQATFTQTVLPPQRAGEQEGQPVTPPRTSTGRFAFQRPDRFRFIYEQPYEQTIVGDGQRVWIYDPDLRQASARRLGDALGSTPAALLAGSDLRRDFALTGLPDREGLQWVRATPRTRDGTFQSIDVGFRQGVLAAVDVVDGFDQRTQLRFEGFEANPALPADTFTFTPPPGVDVIEQ